MPAKKLAFVLFILFLTLTLTLDAGQVTPKQIHRLIALNSAQVSLDPDIN